MAKTGRAVAKLVEKNKRNKSRAAHGTMKAVLTRTKSPHHEKRVAFEHHQWLIQTHAINLGPRVTTLSKDGKTTGVVFRGDGLPEEVTRAPAKPKEDKRAPIKAEARDDWKPRRNKFKPYDPVMFALSLHYIR